MNATITYRLSTAGQRTALAAGLPATNIQEAIIEISAADLDLFSVDGNGALSADLRDGGVRRGYYWQSAEFDAILTAETAVAWLRERDVLRAAALATEAAEARLEKIAAAEKAAATRLAHRELMVNAINTQNLTGIVCWATEIRVGIQPVTRTYTPATRQTPKSRPWSAKSSRSTKSRRPKPPPPPKLRPP